VNVWPDCANTSNTELVLFSALELYGRCCSVNFVGSRLGYIPSLRSVASVPSRGFARGSEQSTRPVGVGIETLETL